MLLNNGRTADQAVMERFESLAASPDLHDRPGEAADMLLVLAHALQGVRDRVLAERFVALGRRLAFPAAMELLIDRAMQGHVDVAWVAPALRFGGVPSVSLAIRRLGAVSDDAYRRVACALARELALFAELREAAITALRIAHRNGSWAEAQDALALLASLGAAPLPAEEPAASAS